MKICLNGFLALVLASAVIVGHAALFNALAA